MSYEPRQVFRWKDPASHPQAPALAIYFEPMAQVNDAATRETGKQTYDNVLIAYVAPIGQPKSEASHEVERTLPDGTVKVNHHYAMKYAEPLKFYKAGTEAETLGTPLRDLLGMTPATAMNLKARGVHTIEMMAEMPDSAGNDMMGFWDLRDRAKKHLEAREKEAPAKHLEAELAQRDALITSQQRQIDELRALIGDQPERRGPGRPRKTDVERALETDQAA